jgi:hypothetical protein
VPGNQLWVVTVDKVLAVGFFQGCFQPRVDATIGFNSVLTAVDFHGIAVSVAYPFSLSIAN